jgi:hypothetical protein
MYNNMVKKTPALCCSESILMGALQFLIVLLAVLESRLKLHGLTGGITFAGDA